MHQVAKIWGIEYWSLCQRLNSFPIINTKIQKLFFNFSFITIMMLLPFFPIKIFFKYLPKTELSAKIWVAYKNVPKKTLLQDKRCTNKPWKDSSKKSKSKRKTLFVREPLESFGVSNIFVNIDYLLI